MMSYIVMLIALAALFINIRKPSLSYFIWIGTNFWWLLVNFQKADYAEAVMFAGFMISCVICWWVTVKKNFF